MHFNFTVILNIYIHRDFCAIQVVKYLDDFQWLSESKWSISNIQTKGHCTGRQTRHLQNTTSHYHGLKLRVNLSKDHFLIAFNIYRHQNSFTFVTPLNQKAIVLKHRGISFIKSNYMMASMMFVHKYMNHWRGHSLWPQW